MTNIHLIPGWFYGIDSLMQIIYAIITLLIGIYAYKTYRISEQRESKLFSLSFFLISLSYFILSIRNFIRFDLRDGELFELIEMSTIGIAHLYSFYVYIFFYLVGLITLVYTGLGKKSGKSYSLVFALAFAPLLITNDLVRAFYIVSSILLIFIIGFYLMKYFDIRKRRILVVIFAFILLLLGRLTFLFSRGDSIFYPLAHFIILIAYAILLTNLILVIRKWRKKEASSR